MAPASVFKVREVLLDLSVTQQARSASFLLAERANASLALDIPTELLKAEGDVLVFRPYEELRDSADADLRAFLEKARSDLRKALAEPFELVLDAGTEHGCFLGLKVSHSQKWTATARLSPDIVDGYAALDERTPVFAAEAKAAVEVTLNGAGETRRAEAVLSLAVSKVDVADLARAVRCAFRVEGDFSLRLPEFDFPDIRIDMPDWTLGVPDISRWLPSINGFSFLPSGLFDEWKLSIGWGGNEPKLTVTVKDGALSLELAPSCSGKPQEGTIRIGSVVIGKITALQASLNDKAFTYRFGLEAATSFDLPDTRIDSEALPFILELKSVTIAPGFEFDDDSGVPGAGFRAQTVIGVGRLTVTARDNPAVFLALSAELAVKADAKGNVTTKLTSLRVVEPWPLELVKQGAGLVGRLVRLIAAIPLPDGPDPDPAVRLLRRLAELLASAARWLARQVGKAAGLLAGVAEAVAEALIALVEGFIALGTRLAEDGKRLLTHVCVEVRLDPETWRLRQIAIMPAFHGPPTGKELSVTALGFDIAATLTMHPSLVFDFGPDKWFGLVVRPDEATHARIATDFWLERASAPSQAMGTSGDEATAQARLVEITVKPAKGRTPEIAVAAIRRGRLKLFDMLGAERGGTVDVPLPGGGTVSVVALTEAKLTDSASIAFHVDGQATSDQPANPDFEVHLDYDDTRLEALKQRVLALLPKAAPGSGSGVVDKLKQKVEFEDVSYAFKDGATPTLEAGFGVIVQLADNFAPKATLVVEVGLRDLSMKLTAGDRISIFADKTKDPVQYRPLGLDLAVRYDEKKTLPSDRKDRYEQFFIDLSRGGERFGLGREAKAELSFAAVSTAGRGLLFDIADFSAGRRGFDFDATVRPDPVRLGGVDVPFRFTSGRLAIRQSSFNGASLAGSGQLPPALVGEANANIALRLGAAPDGSVVVESATARLDKSGDPIRCNAIRFELTITELGFSFVHDGSYHFYFQLTGSAVFRPPAKEFSSGLLKSFRDVEIRLDKAPLAADPRVLMRSISFHAKVDPPAQAKFFDLFAFELRGIGFYPASDAFGGDPALSVSGKVDFTDFGDVPVAGIRVHDLWISTPEKGRVLPRIRFDGLGVAISRGPLKIDATAIAIDGSLPKDLHRPDVLPANVTAEGFLAKGSIELSGWAPMSAAMGFLELRDRKGGGRPRHSFFVYGQFEKQTVPIPTPVGEIYLREYGFGFGYRYTLAGIAEAETASSPQALVAILDEVSKYQGSLNDFKAWQPTYDNGDLTLALRGLFSIARSQGSQGDVYDEKGEAELPNPLLFDIVAALRTDLTFLINLRGWIAVNYNDWADAPTNTDWKSNPTMRGYLYLSVPRKEFLGRFVAGGGGHIGEHPKLPEPLRRAIKASDYSATLYIRPGLFHFELGWPYELGFELGKPEDAFHLVLRGGLVQRIEDAALLTGIAFKATGKVHLEGRIGSDSFGAAAVARAQFEIEARLLSYLSLRRFGDSFYYGYFRFDATLSVGVSVWISFRIFRKRIRLSVGFSLHLSVSVAIEAVITGEGKLGGRAHASVGVRAFGRSLSVGIGFSFNAGQLDQARARVARFMELGLGAQIPDKAEDGKKAEIAPPPLVPADEATAIGDAAVDHDLGGAPAPVDPPPPGEEDHDFTGDPFRPTDFWAILFPTKASARPGENSYVMQLVPRDHADLRPDAYRKMKGGTQKSTFYTSPKVFENGPAEAWHRLDFRGGKPDPITEIVRIAAGADGTAPSIEPVAFGLPLPLACKAIVDRDGDLDFAGYLSGLFLLRSPQEGDPAGLGFVASEPRPRIHAEAGALPEDADAAALELGRAGRSRICLSAQQKREAEIAEARSATIASVCESAARVAASLLQHENGPPRIGEIDARDFGLTFLVSEKELDALFPDHGQADTDPAPALFGVEKSDAPGTPGSVHLFNPPHRMFRAAQPGFRPRHEIGPEGIRLDWDLEPAWGASQTAYHDPEFHLKHYRISRMLTVGEAVYVADFTVKASGIERLTVEEDGSTVVVRTPPPFQFVDDLLGQGEDGRGGVPAVIRDVLLGKAADLGEWEKAVRVPLETVRLDYRIVPIDIAGTSDAGEPYTITGFAAPVVHAASPREAVLQVRYQAIPAAGFEVPGGPGERAPELRFLLRPAVAVTGVDNAPALDLRIVEDMAIPSGAYGSDALDEARTRLDEAAVEKLAGQAGVDDFVLTPTKDPAQAIPIVFEHASSEGGEPVLSTVFYTVDKGVETLRDALGATGSAKVLERPGLVRRAWLRAGAVGDRRQGGWRDVGFNIVIENLRATGATPAGANAAVSTRVEAFEQPVNLAFKALTRADLAGESGNMHIFYPEPDSSLGALVEGGGLKLMADAQRRTAVRLRWNARPVKLDLAAGKDADKDRENLFRWIGGYEVHVLDPDAAIETDDPDDKAAFAASARLVGRLALSPPDLRGLEPPGFGDFGRIEAHYPSGTVRLDKAPRAARAGKAGWFSAAESTVLFPEPCIRRSLMPAPDDAELAQLFAGGRPDRLTIRIVHGEIGNPLADWSLHSGEHAGTGDSLIVEADEFPITALSLRALLGALQLRPTGEKAKAQERTALAVRLGDPSHLASVRIRIDAERRKAAPDGVIMKDAWASTRQVEHSVDLMPRLHPVLADALAFVQYEGAGLCRRYAIVDDPDPQVEDGGFEDYVAATPPQRDPYGWRALRLLGLARGFRLYDKIGGAYLPREAALRAVQQSMEKALTIYEDVDCGQPFVDLLTRPWGNSRLFWFDGGSREPTGEEVRGLLANETLAVMQIALRPVPDRLGGGKPVVRYYGFSLKPDAASKTETDKALLSLKENGPGVAVDVLAVHSGLESVRPVRLTRQAPGITLGTVAALPKGRDIAIVRIASFARDDVLPEHVLKALVGDKEALAGCFREIDRPVVLDGGPGSDTAFGKFEALSDGDWADALFRPAAIETEAFDVKPVEAFERLSGYLGRRFGRVVVPVGEAVEKVEHQDAIDARTRLAGRIVRFWAPFLEHCAVPRQKDPAQEGSPPIFFSLGTIAEPGLWQQAPDEHGKLSILIPETDRRGKRYKFAVRPVGRYRNWAEASPSMAVAGRLGPTMLPSGLSGAFDDGEWLRRFADITIPRSEPLDKPVILAARRTRPDERRAEGGRFELVIAHSTDMVLAQANRRNAALLAPQELAIGFWREFPHTGWSGALARRLGSAIDPNGAFGELDPAALKQETLTLDRDTAKAMLDGLRELVPDAWLGSTAVSAYMPPYFFRTHALVHMAAGIVVSEQVEAVNEEGFWELRWPDDRQSGDPRRTIAKEGPAYRVMRKPIEDDGDPAMPPRFAIDIQIDLPAMRFIDCIAKEDAEIWFTGNGADPYGGIGDLVHLPEPGLNYRIGIETVTGDGEILQRVPEFDILPNPPEGEAEKAGLYLCLPQQSGLRLAPEAAAELSPTGEDRREWRIRVATTLRPRGGASLAYSPLMRTVAKEQRPALLHALGRLESSDAVAGLAVVTLAFEQASGLPAPDQWNRLEEVLARHRAWEALETVRAWRAEWIEDPEAEPPVARNPPNYGAQLLILIERKASADDEVLAALAAVAGGEPKVSDVDRLILRAPPTEKELHAFAAGDDDGSKALEGFVRAIAEEQLFGAGRKLTLLAMKGEATPLRKVVERAARSAKEGQDRKVSS